MKLNVLIWNILDGRNQSVDFLIEYLDDHPEIQLVGLLESFGERKTPEYFDTTFTRVDKNRDEILEELYERFPELQKPYADYNFKHKATQLFMRTGANIVVEQKYATADASVYFYHIDNKDFNLSGGVLLGLTHFKAKNNESEKSQERIIDKTIDEIFSLERKLEHELDLAGRLLLAGDFNANPYERVLLDYDCLNATPSRWLARRSPVKRGAHRYLFFYNPSWSLLSENHPMDNEELSPVGTLTHDPALKFLSTSARYWNVFDQVLVRPELIDLFNDDSLRVIDRHKNQHLMNGGKVNSQDYSDHLPIRFTLDL